MLTTRENELLTRVEGDAPMGRMMRATYWIPAATSRTLIADGTPQRVRLFGDDFVAFRATDGRVGFFDERCPHRGVSLALARNENCALQCIFHGWRFHVSGETIETPTQAIAAEQFAKTIKVNHYPVREAGGLVWVWLGGGAPAPFPDFPFTHLAEHQISMGATKVPVNYLQGLEATLDSSHIAYLHRDWIGDLGAAFKTTGDVHAPEFRFVSQPYGFSAGALRQRPDGRTDVRCAEFVLPFHTSTPTSRPGMGSFQFLVPIDDVTTWWLIIFWNAHGPIDPAVLEIQGPEHADLDNFVPPLGGPETHWGQDRAAMKAGSFSGFRAGLLSEDTVVQVSMGPIADRTKEQLCSGDAAIVRLRRTLLDAAARHQAGKPVNPHAMSYRTLQAHAGVVDTVGSWTDLAGAEIAPG
ncbi:Phthalate 4,5-dioxygenase oxygenase subunit [Alphaproteobacteria bacterium SO-S41]|nr:Phthalate 4,5-dioxygenase oxygenase subunit [Alphaproteobacteria bacterium SO-S41]